MTLLTLLILLLLLQKCCSVISLRNSIIVLHGNNRAINQCRGKGGRGEGARRESLLCVRKPIIGYGIHEQGERQRESDIFLTLLIDIIMDLRDVVKYTNRRYCRYISRSGRELLTY